jgi:aminoglycoside phosphotransferase (APT) family kinase protein
MIEAALPPPPVDYESGWQPVPEGDAVIAFLHRQPWASERERSGWLVRRLTGGAYLYRAPGGWQVVGKFYAAKTDRFPVEYARQELEAIRRARAALPAAGKEVVRPYTLWHGVIFLEYLSGPTLEQILGSPHALMARSEAGLREVARFLARLHGATAQPAAWPNFNPVHEHAQRVIADLAADLLRGEPRRWQCLRDLVARQAECESLSSFTPVFTHGDATTGNFIFDSAGDLVALDWERAQVADPAADLGRLLAEVGHSLRQQRYDESAVVALLQATKDAYGEWDAGAGARADDRWERLQSRARFYEAIGMLRIARNAWVGRPFRQSLVERAEALLEESCSP